MTLTKELFDTATNGFEGAKVEIENHSIYYEVLKGSEHPERTIILSHGACGTGRYMKPLAVRLAEQFPQDRIVILDLPEHGLSKSDKPLGVIGVQVYAELVKEILETLQSEGVIEGKLQWIGWSMGGSIGLLLDLAGVHIDELVLLNSAPKWDSIGAVMELLKDIPTEEALAETFKNILISNFQAGVTDEERALLIDAYPELTCDTDIMVQDFVAILPETFDVVPELENIQSKTLLIGGTEDKVAEERYQHIMLEEIPDVELLLTEDDHSQLVKPTMIEIIVKGIADRFNA